MMTEWWRGRWPLPIILVKLPQPFKVWSSTTDLDPKPHALVSATEGADLRRSER